MATITAKFAGTCRKCGGSFSAGAQIEWSKGAGSTHLSCPASAPKAVAQPAAKTAAPSVAEAPFEVWEVSRHGKPGVAIGDTRRYALGPATRTVRGQPAETRAPAITCPVCGAAPDAPCIPREGAELIDPPAYRALFGPAHAVRAAVPDHEEPIPEARRRESLPKVRAGATAEAEEGVYTVVAAGPWRYQNAEDNEDMGDMRGANWSGPVYLRRATAEEVEADTQERLAEAIPGICLAIAVWVDKAEDRWAHEAMAAAAAQPGWGRVESFSSYLTEEERKAQEAAVDVWRGHRAEHGSWATTGSYVRTWTLPSGETVWESWQYIYDWDQPRVLVAPLALVERIQAAQTEARRKQDEERAIQDRIRAGDAPVIRERFLRELETVAAGEVRGGVQIQDPLPADWTLLRDEIVALGDAAFAEPREDASPLATLLFAATGGRAGSTYRHGGSPRFIYGEWKRLATARAKLAAEAEVKAAIAASGVDLADGSGPALDAEGARMVAEASTEAKRRARPRRGKGKAAS